MTLPIIGSIGTMAAQTFSTVLGVIIGQTLAPALMPVADKIGQTAYSILSTRLLSITEAIEARHRNEITESQFVDELKKQGFDADRRDWLYKISENLLGIMEQVSLYRRGVIDDGELAVEAAKLKWTEDRLENLLKVTEVIPSATDIILFAVREVYSPEIAEAFGQYEGAEAVYNMAFDDLTAIGMTQDTFTKYWAAHWLLPSVGQGFEMMHRGVIGQVSTAAEP
ncbi:unnamed protein product, partial [marine sediment metagenome]